MFERQFFFEDLTERWDSLQHTVKLLNAQIDAMNGCIIIALNAGNALAVQQFTETRDMMLQNLSDTRLEIETLVNSGLKHHDKE